MEGEANGTLHPSCGASEPPYSQELLQSLDLPGRFLFAILTLMMLIANLVFIEEAVYIYRKIPSSKRSIIIWVNAAAPVIATTSCTGMWIPRSTMFTDFTAAVFFAIVIHKFLMMMIKDCGGQKLLLKRFENGHFKISTGPCCCCCLCLPRVRITRYLQGKQGAAPRAGFMPFRNMYYQAVLGKLTRFMAISCSILNGSLLFAGAALMAVLRAQGAIVKTTLRSLFWLKLGTLQFAFLRPVLMFLSIVLWTNGNYTLYNVSTKGAAIWISCVVGVLTIIALWPVAIMFQQVRTLLICKKIIPKFALYQFILILNHLQTSIINILATQRIIPCAPPLSSSARGAYMTQQLLIMEMFLITLISRVVYRRKYNDLEPLECKAEEAGDNKQTPKIILNGTVTEDGLPRV